LLYLAWSEHTDPSKQAYYLGLLWWPSSLALTLINGPQDPKHPDWREAMSTPQGRPRKRTQALCLGPMQDSGLD